MRVKVIAGVFSLVSSIAIAHSQPLPIVGVGRQPCAMLLASTNDPPARLAYVSWALGLVSGFAIAGQNGMLAGHDEDEIEVRLERVCADSPNTLLATAALRVATDLMRQR